MTSDVTAQTRKEQLRAAFRERRAEVTETERMRASERVCARLLDCFEPYEHVAAYKALPGEISLDAFITASFTAGKRVYLPRVDGPQALCFVEVVDLDDLADGPFGLQEPRGEACELAVIEAFAVPGVAFDPAGNRIGFGRGFYDRVLAIRLAQQPTKPADGIVPFLAGVGYHWQISRDVLPTEPHDVALHCIVTDEALVEVLGAD